jgi:hypothetical protein
VAQNTKNAIDTINEISRQLLSLFDVNIESTNHKKNQNHEEPAAIIADDISQLSDDKLADLVTKRDNLIHQLFDKYTQEELINDVDLINEMILIDQQLIEKSQINKTLLADQVLTLRKGKKVNKLYNKY